MKQALLVLFLVVATTSVVMSEPFFGTLFALGVLKFGLDIISLGSSLNKMIPGDHRGFGRSLRSGRSVGDNKVSSIFLKASINDVDDCAKNFVCQLAAKSDESMDGFETTAFAIYGHATSIDVSRSDVEFQLASNVGRLAGIQQCQTIYARCPMSYGQLLQTMEGAFTESETLNHLKI
ncbi:hypothetical protein TCAL_14210 [Tigriopus californicus]|uniref:Pectinesterase inhibitor domain-containing protein n=1 Tax=Tigriopus californicus TaxID=6832 RepID=A0A553NSX4_TIGCA|nr:hypothetical protein TCAL_14210 [Tigriopus californicus]